MSKVRPTQQQRFWAKVNKDGPVPSYAPHLGPCWLWTAGLKRRKQTDGQYGEFDHSYAHLFAYRWIIGPIPEGLDLDHLCRVRHCVNPAHLEPVPRAENLRRGALARQRTHCKNGHELTPENVYQGPGYTGRPCKTCAREYQANFKATRLASGWRRTPNGWVGP